MALYPGNVISELHLLVHVTPLKPLQNVGLMNTKRVQIQAEIKAICIIFLCLLLIFLNMANKLLNYMGNLCLVKQRHIQAGEKPAGK